MRLLRSERAAAGLLLGAAVLGLVLANSPIGPWLIDAKAAHAGFGPLDLTMGQWASDGLLAVFFFVVAVELRHELTVGELSSWHKAMHPSIAALCGVAGPALVYVAITAGSGYEHGWPIPTATDIAFALGVLALFGRGLPRRLRVFLMALAVLDDLVGILIIAIFFAGEPQWMLIGLAVLAVAAFALLTRACRGRWRIPVGAVMVLLALTTWMLVHGSGIHATIAGVALGLAMPRRQAHALTHHLEPWSNGVVLPVFAFSAALVAIPAIPVSQLAPAFWAIVVALPVGKLVGILIGAGLGWVVTPRHRRERFDLAGMTMIGLLGGIGFTVALLMNELAFRAHPEIVDEGTLGVLAGSGISMVLASIAVALLARRHRRREATRTRAEHSDAPRAPHSGPAADADPSLADTNPPAP